MVAVALLMPPLLLCLVLALGRYEECLLKGGSAGQPPQGLPDQPLRAVPDLPSLEPPPVPGEGRHAA
ncbi:hypothetical protein [Streptomyces griseocarneus]|uniref:hypothetical protein n=1 Tax=Streptomyces griseocarneus TaxID=51201 RepID=UPI00167DAAA3|nr:hypothetical protein [Streptomyces griseocarneus]MBZ6475224.1 hypothetical protein [Streptomyces griseocarneus]GHG61556.1 hypothetical protein GCM10018779_29550 [Streptomyces griseocarneus]